MGFCLSEPAQKAVSAMVLPDQFLAASHIARSQLGPARIRHPFLYGSHRFNPFRGVGT